MDVKYLKKYRGSLIFPYRHYFSIISQKQVFFRCNSLTSQDGLQIITDSES